MAKILITSIGTGNYDREAKMPNYRPANYYLGGSEKVVSSAYVYDALYELYGFDKLILVGTCGSQWYALYEHLYQPDSKITPATPLDEDYTYRLLELFDKDNKRLGDVSEMRRELEPLKEAMGGICVEIVVLRYGLNDGEHLENFELLSQIAKYVDDGDALSFDITHSFRSLAMYELLAVSYIKDTKKNVSLDFVSYGMFDFANENNKLSPIVNLSILVNMTEWIKAAEEYRQNGTTALLAELLETDSLGLPISKEEKKVLRRLGGDVILTHDFKEFRNLIKNCVNATKEINGVSRQNVAFDFIFRDMAKRFGDWLDDDMSLHTELAKWHYEKKRYIQAAITIIEATIDYCARLARIDKEQVRGRMLNIRSTNSNVGNFRERYNTIRKLRNKLAHAEVLSEYELGTLEEYTKGFYTTYKSQFKDNSENAEALRNALGGAAYREDDIY